jgi:hypothetical protein
VRGRKEGKKEGKGGGDLKLGLQVWYSNNLEAEPNKAGKQWHRGTLGKKC